ncbi:fucolectin-1-like [Polypterus senegalus]|uniref:fucolectin-1-like n=1 Tax=Polypterus senegalus TaxID=55291 RepID=UPI001964A01A|nr:fucolectin-1-like [Polypterus senegalus]
MKSDRRQVHDWNIAGDPLGQSGLLSSKFSLQQIALVNELTEVMAKTVAKTVKVVASGGSDNETLILVRRGIAEQSSFYSNLGDVSHAIDGRRNGNFGDGRCTHTVLETSPWWRVNLRATYAISSVVVYNRQDCCDDRLNGAEIRVGDSPDVSEHVKCGTIEETYPGSVHTICCHGRRGQYVSVVLPNQLQYLTLCEVEVYGEAIDQSMEYGSADI